MCISNPVLTALYKALSRSISLLSGTDHSNNDWIIALTDGEDNSSQEITVDSVMNELGRTDIGLIIIGVGADIQPSVSIYILPYFRSRTDSILENCLCLPLADIETASRKCSEFSRSLCLCRRRHGKHQQCVQSSIFYH